MNGIVELANDVGETAFALSPTFGIPATVCSNVSRAVGIALVTRVPTENLTYSANAI